MSKKQPVPAPPDGMILRRRFRLRDRVLTCGISNAGPNKFNVITLPHWDADGGLVETFIDPAAALMRHAAITAQLKEDGWAPASSLTSEAFRA